MPGGEVQSQLGVGPHPHRGFAPVTYIFEGNIHHRDSMGNSSIVHKGGTQWMHSGSGIIHSERPSKELAELGGKFEFLQIWINTPSSNKMTAPYYLPLNKDEIPEISDESKTIGVFSGTLSGVTGKIKYGSPLTTARFELKAGANFKFEIEKNQNLFNRKASASIRRIKSQTAELNKRLFDWNSLPDKVKSIKDHDEFKTNRRVNIIMFYLHFCKK